MTSKEANEQTGREYVIEEVTDLEKAWPDIRRLFLAFEAYNAGFLKRRLRDDWEARSRDLLATRKPLIVLGRDGEQTAGYLMAFLVTENVLFDQRFVHISEAFVLPEHRGGGLGTAMLQRAEAWAMEREAPDMRLDVYVANELGRRFWDRGGFEVESYTMRKTLEASP